MASSSSHSSFSSVYMDYEYDVFLSFRGQDTHKNFTGHLYNALDNQGVHTFMYFEELTVEEEIGSKLITAIQQSRISIPIFSKNYASSKWCLNELHKILECYERNDQIVLPIFLDVIPSEVRSQTGSFGNGFRKHENNSEPEIVDAWRKALRKIGKLKGWVLPEVENGDESKLIQLVVGTVLRNLKATTMMVAKNPIGLDSHVQSMLSLLCLDSTDRRIVGICGMGGSGKTTLAKAVYNRIFKRFDGCSFLANVSGRASKPMGLVDLQIQLLNNILTKHSNHISDADMGSKMIERRLKNIKILLMIDDVDNCEQLNALAGDLSWFGLGSRIIITTRNELVLQTGKIVNNCIIYNIDLLNDDQSLQLFSLHAFGRDHPPDNMLLLSREIVSYTRGLPLILEVLGNFLHDMGKKEWKLALKKLKGHPSDIFERLKISYYILDENEKSIFLDLACFFIGMDKEIASYFWEGCGFHPTTVLKSLIEKSFLRIGEDDKLMMHDQLRELGRRIVHEESPNEPNERSRLWFLEDIKEVLTEQKGTGKVEAISPYEWEIGDCFRVEDFAMMANLRMLQINGVGLEGEIEDLPSRLRWLSWQRCPLKIIPSNFCLEELVVLDLTDSNTDVWNSEIQNKRFENLKVLNLSNCSNLAKSPDFSRFPQLEKLILKRCTALVDMESIGQLKSLIHLDLNECNKLTGKINIRGLPSLRKLISCNGRKLEKVTP